jgi:hypothetical protein
MSKPYVGIFHNRFSIVGPESSRQDIDRNIVNALSTQECGRRRRVSVSAVERRRGQVNIKRKAGLRKIYQNYNFKNINFVVKSLFTVNMLYFRY